MMNKTNFKNKTKCVRFFTRTYETKHNTDGPFIYRHLKKVTISILLQKVCLGWKLSPIINRWGIGIRMSWVEEKRKIKWWGGVSIRHSRVI